MEAGYAPQELPALLLGDPESLQPFFVDVKLDARAHERPQFLGGDGVELYRGGAAELLRARVLGLGRARRQIPLLDLLSCDGHPLEMNVDTGGIAPKLL